MTAYRDPGRRGSRTVLLGLAFAALGVWFVGRGDRTPAGAVVPGNDPCDHEIPGACLNQPAAPEFTSASAAAPTRLDGSRICPTAGYLCGGLEQRGSLRVLRWNESTPEIKIRVPRPSGEDSHTAVTLQQAAARGISVWNGHPIALRVVFSDRPGDEDFAVRWGPSLGGRELGRVETRWVQSGGVATLEVGDFALSTRGPYSPQEVLEAAQVTLTAAHEMGHALGLPHSDSERDVMFPTNTASSLSTRDFRTMEALYSLENGAEIHPGG